MTMPLDARVGWCTILNLSRPPRRRLADEFFPYHVLDNILRWFATFTPPNVLDIITAQIQQITKGGNAGLLTFGVL